MTDTAKFRYLGVTDECTECQCCGKPNLRSTVVLDILDEEGNGGEVTYYGSTCAAKALGVRGGGRAVLQSAQWAMLKRRDEVDDAVHMLTFYGLPLAGEPTQDQVREAMRRYTRQHPNIADTVARTGIGVRARVLDMLDRKRKALREGALVGVYPRKEASS